MGSMGKYLIFVTWGIFRWQSQQHMVVHGSFHMPCKVRCHCHYPSAFGDSKNPLAKTKVYAVGCWFRGTVEFYLIPLQEIGVLPTMGCGFPNYASPSLPIFVYNKNSGCWPEYKYPISPSFCYDAYLWYAFFTFFWLM